MPERFDRFREVNRRRNYSVWIFFFFCFFWKPSQIDRDKGRIWSKVGPSGQRSSWPEKRDGWVRDGKKDEQGSIGQHHHILNGCIFQKQPLKIGPTKTLLRNVYFNGV